MNFRGNVIDTKCYIEIVKLVHSNPYVNTVEFDVCPKFLKGQGLYEPAYTLLNFKFTPLEKYD